MRSINSTFEAQKNSKACQPVYLYTVVNYDGASHDLNYAEYESDVVYGGVTYSRFPIKHEFISENVQGSIDQVKLTVANVSRVIEGYLTSYDLRGKQVKIKFVWADELADASAYMEETYYIDSYIADINNVLFTLSSKFDVLDVTLPARSYMRNYCSWKFKSTQCGYAGAETECNKTFARCGELANKVRFGGFPSIPSEQIFAG